MNTIHVVRCGAILKWVAVCCFLALIALEGTVSADVIVFDTLTPNNDEFNDDASVGIGRYSSEMVVDAWLAIPFTTPSGGPVDSLRAELAILYGFLSGPNTLEVVIAGDNGGEPDLQYNDPGVASVIVNDLPETFDQFTLTDAVFSSLNLQPDTPYWLALRIPDSVPHTDSVQFDWFQSDIVSASLAFGVFFDQQNPSPWEISNPYNLPAARLTVTQSQAVPEPSQMLLLGIGGAFCYVRRRFHGKGATANESGSSTGCMQ